MNKSGEDVSFMSLSRLSSRPVRRRFWLPILVFLCLNLGGCQRGGETENQYPIPIAVTIPPQKWLVERIGGSKVSCFVLVPHNQDPHTFLGTDADAARVARCRLFFTIGLPIENSPWCRAVAQEGGLRFVSMLQAAETPSREDAPALGHSEETPRVPNAVVPSGEPSGEPDKHDHETSRRQDSGDAHPGSETSHEHADEIHIWLSPRRLMMMGEIVASTLRELDPQNSAYYDSNGKALREELAQLDKELQEKLAPLQGQEFFVFHPAWECFAEDYGLVQVAVESQGKEPSDHEVTELQRRARQAMIKVMLVQPQFSSPAVQAIAEEAGLAIVAANPLAEDVPSELRRVAETLVSAYRDRKGSIH